MQDDNYDDEEAQPLSKTQRKAAMQDLQDLGAELVALSPGHLARIGLPENLYQAVRDWQRFTKNEAKRRQLQYVGKLMRSIDPEPIQAGLALIRGESAAETARFHRLEQLRNRLMADENVLQEIVASWPGADLTHLRQLRRNALKEQEAGKPPKNFRALFQALRELTEQAEND